MLATCEHIAEVLEVVPSARGCEESRWVHLRICRTCGHVGCCDGSPNRHATAHFNPTGDPIVEGYDPPEGWGWRYVDRTFVDLGGSTTPQLGRSPASSERRTGPIPRGDVRHAGCCARSTSRANQEAPIGLIASL
jgi:hypothetical protein